MQSSLLCVVPSFLLEGQLGGPSLASPRSGSKRLRVPVRRSRRRRRPSLVSLLSSSSPRFQTSSDGHFVLLASTLPLSDLPGSFPSPHAQAHRHPASPSTPTPSSSRRQPSGPIFRFGMGGGSITIGGGSGGSGRRAGYGAEQGSPGPLRTSHMEGVPTLAE